MTGCCGHIGNRSFVQHQNQTSGHLTKPSKPLKSRLVTKEQLKSYRQERNLVYVFASQEFHLIQTQLFLMKTLKQIQTTCTNPHVCICIHIHTDIKMMWI